MEGAAQFPDRVRAFVALRMNAEVEDTLAQLVETLRVSSGDVRWVRRANLHLTLRFLGDRVAARQLVRVHRGLEEIAARTAPFVIGVRGTGTFPNSERPQVVWVGLASGELVDLAGRVEAVAVRCGFAPERRPFAPHLTIGRVRNQHGWVAVRPSLIEAAARDFGETRAESMVLYRSVLGPETSTYSELARYALGGAAQDLRRTADR
jgi:2'-5' RNA ligase